jgi:hypothetical protein
MTGSVPVQSATNKSVAFTEEGITYDDTTFSFSDKNNSLSNDDRLVLDNAGAAEAEIASLNDLKDITGLEALEGVSFAAITGTGATNEAAIADANAQAAAQLNSIIADFNSQLEDAKAFFDTLDKNQDFDSDALKDNSPGMGDYELTAQGVKVKDSDPAEYAATALALAALGFEWDSGSWKHSDGDSDGFMDGLNDAVDGVKIDAATVVPTLIGTAGNLEAEAAQTTKRLVVGSQPLRYSTFGYYKEENLERAKGEAADTKVVDNVDPFFGGNGQVAQIDTKDAMLAALGATDAIFSGKTVAALSVGDAEKAYADLSGRATLTIGTSTESLSLQFNNWYDVNFETATTAKLIYKDDSTFGDFTLTATASGDFDASNDLDANTASFSAAYFDSGSGYAEAVGKFSASDNGTKTNEYFQLDGAFGVVK